MSDFCGKPFRPPKKGRKHIPVVTLGEDDLPDAIEACAGSKESRQRNDRSRPYDGQPWTAQGVRGKKIVQGLTMRDLLDCMVQGLLVSDPDAGASKKVTEISPDFSGTKYAADGTWTYEDVHEVDMSRVDPIVAFSNALLFVEHMMGIFPNLEGCPSTQDIMDEIEGIEE